VTNCEAGVTLTPNVTLTPHVTLTQDVTLTLVTPHVTLTPVTPHVTLTSLVVENVTVTNIAKCQHDTVLMMSW